MAVRGVRDVAVIHAVRMLAGDDFGDGDPLALPLVCEHRRTSDIADGVNALGRRGHRLIDLHEALLRELNASVLQSEVLDVGRAAGGNQHLFYLERLLFTAYFHRHRDGALPRLDAADLGSGENIDLSLLEGALELFRAVDVLKWQQHGQHLEQGDAAAERAEDVGEFAADGAGTDDGDRGRRLLEHESFVGGYDGRLVQLETDLWESLYPRARRDDDPLLRLVPLFPPIGQLDGHGANYLPAP